MKTNSQDIKKLIISVAALAAVLGAEQARAQCAMIQGVFATAGAEREKCLANPEFEASPPVTNYYLTYTEIQTASYSAYFGAGSGYWGFTTTTPHTTCSGGCSVGCSTTTTYMGNDTWTDGDGIFVDYVDPTTGDQIGDNLDKSTAATGYAEAAEFGYPSVTSPTTMDVENSGVDGYGGDATFKWSAFLENEDTDSMVRQDAMATMSAYSGWVTNRPTFPPPGFGSAHYTVDSYHINFTVGKMKYFFIVTDCQPHDRYRVSWTEETTYPNGAPPSDNNLHETLTGSDPTVGINTSTHEIDVPNIPSTISIKNIKVTEVDKGGS